MKRGALLPRVGSLVLLLGSGLGWAGQYDEKERAELAQALKGTKMSLKQGIVASASKGKPISAKFEVEDGKLQLSVYTAKGGQFSEVAVDPKSGRVAKVEAIKGGEDLTAAKAQADAMAKAKTPLGDALAHDPDAQRVWWYCAGCHVVRRGSIAHVEHVIRRYAPNLERLR